MRGFKHGSVQIKACLFNPVYGEFLPSQAVGEMTVNCACPCRQGYKDPLPSKNLSSLNGCGLTRNLMAGGISEIKPFPLVGEQSRDL